MQYIQGTVEGLKITQCVYELGMKPILPE